MFLDLSIMGWVGTVTFIVLHALIARRRHAQTPIPICPSSRQPRTLRFARWTAGWTSACAAIVLTLTGWSGVWQGVSLTGYGLMLHVVVGAVFALALAIWVILSADRVVGLAFHHAAYRGMGLCFWLMVGWSLPLILSIALNLWPLFTMEQQEALTWCHRLSALAFVLTATVYVYMVWRHRTMETRLTKKKQKRRRHGTRNGV